MNFFATAQVGTMLASLTISVLIASLSCNEPKTSNPTKLNRGNP
jgi:hypothetical protein